MGEKNPNYKGNSDERRLARGLFKTISKEMLRNCDFTCQVCGRRGGNLNTHHIKPFSVILDEFMHNAYSGNIKNFHHEIISYDDFTDKTNLIVVCEECHKQIHYTDNPELSPLRWKSATTIESIEDKPINFEEASRVESSDSKCEDT